MLRVDRVPAWSFRLPGPVWLVRLPAIESWRALCADPDWDRLVTRAEETFSLMTVSGDPRPHLDAWSALVVSCLATTRLGSTHSWGTGSTVLDDLVDETWLSRNGWRNDDGARCGIGPPPLTSWDDGGPLRSSVEEFCGLGVGLDGPVGQRIVLVVDDAGPAAWDDTLGAVRSIALP